MKIYFAPMEGITGYVYRNAYHKFFHHIDHYFSPFIAANQSASLRTRDIKDILPENNKDLNLVPQILTNQARDFIRTARRIKDLGYQEVNLNLGCPSGTVAAKKRGAGFLGFPEELDAFLEEIYGSGITEISIKTRLGIENPEEFYELLSIFNQYPVKELIIHPRVQKDFYKNKPNWKVFQDAVRLSKNPVCYNGDIFTREAYEEFLKEFPKVGCVMLGRGMIANPGLAGELAGEPVVDKMVLRRFHDEIYTGYQEILSGERNVLFKMKELWFYLCRIFTNHEKYAKKIRKAQKGKDYEETVNHLFTFEEIQIERQNFQFTA